MFWKNFNCKNFLLGIFSLTHISLASMHEFTLHASSAFLHQLKFKNSLAYVKGTWLRGLWLIGCRKALPSSYAIAFKSWRHLSSKQSEKIGTGRRLDDLLDRSGVYARSLRDVFSARLLTANYFSVRLRTLLGFDPFKWKKFLENFFISTQRCAITLEIKFLAQSCVAHSLDGNKKIHPESTHQFCILQKMKMRSNGW